jgi:hypothetical protein
MQPGEFLYCLARRFNVDPDEMLQINGLNDFATIYAGIVLKIPQSGKPFPGERTLRPHPVKYTVTSSDETIYSVACVYPDVFPENIALVNALPIDSTLSAGQVLQIP